MMLFSRKRVEAFRRLFETEDGKFVLKCLAKEVRAYEPILASNDPYLTAFNEGRRAVYNHIVSVIAANPELLEMSFKKEESNEQLRKILSEGGIDL